MISVHASAFAGLIGKHAYVKHHEAFEKIWERVSPTTFVSALARHGRQTARQRLQTLQTTAPEIARSLAVAERVGSMAPETCAVTDTKAALTEDIDALGLSKDDAAIVKDEIRKQLFTHYGTAKETSVIDILNREMDLDVRDDDALYARTFTTPGGIPWRLAGRIDGITGDRSTVIEVKNRVNRLFGTPPPYERIQVECYLRLVDDAHRAILVESLRTHQEHAATINLIPMTRDDALWDECTARMNVVLEYLAALIDDEAMQDIYLAKPASILRALLK